MTRARAISRLTADPRRAWLSSIIAIVLGTGAPLAWTIWSLRQGRALDPQMIQVVGFVTTFTLMFVLFPWLTWLAFAPLPADRLRRVVEVTNPQSRSDRRLRALAGVNASGWTATAALLALLGVLLVSIDSELRSNPLVLTGSVLVVVTGWVTIIIANALAYLREDVDRPGLEFPGDHGPVWRDYVYLAAQVSTTFATSDVSVVSTRMRGLVTAHSFIAFVFNTVIVALLVSTLIALS